MEFTIVVPVYNEAGNVAPLLAEINQAMAGFDQWEVVYVDDGSDDGTAAELHAMQQQFPRLRVLHHSQRCGQSGALLNGVRAATGTWIISLDGDGQNNPADIPRLLEQVQKTDLPDQPLMLIGHRMHRKDRWLRCWSSRIANFVRSHILGDATPDSGCGLKVFPRKLFLLLPAFDHMHRFLPALMQRQGVQVTSVAITHRPRQRGQSKYGVQNRLWVGLVDLAGVMWLQRRLIRSSNVSNRATPDGPGARVADLLGVYWLQRRSCSAAVEEER